MLLTFNIKNQLIFRTDKEIPVANSENYLYAQFSFTDDWEGTKTALFGDYSIQLDEDNKCLVPWESIKEPGFSVSVFCGQRVTANVAYVDVLPSGYKEGQTPQPPSPTVYDQILDELEKRLSAEDVLAGTNVTVTKNADGTITISAQGGGSGDIQIDASLKKVNDVYGIDFTSFDPTDEEAPFDKPNNALSATTLVAVLTKALATALASYYTKTQTDTLLNGKANAFNVGNGLLKASNVLKALTNAQFVDTLPTSNINEEATYYIADTKVFPDVSGFDTTGSYPTIFVAYNEDDSKWYLMRYEGESLFHWYYHNVQDKTYEIYTLNATQDGWTLVESGTNSNWANYFDVGNNDGDKLKAEIWYANTTIYLYGDGKTYTTASNKADKYGVPVDLSNLNPYIQIGYQRKGNEWINLGRSDFTKLFEGLINTSAIKQTTGQSTSDLMSQKAVTDELSGKQATLVNQSNIKSINGTSLLGSGDLVVGGGDVDTAMSDSSTNAVQNKVIKSYVDTEIDNTIGDAMMQILGEVTV